MSDGTDEGARRLAAALAAVDPVDRTPPATARRAAVLVLLAEGAAGSRIVLTRRRADLRSHPGQVALPGGRIEPGESAVAAALREAGEEVGLNPGSVAVLGTAPTFHVPPSRFWVVPVVARWERPHPLRPDPAEVDAVLEVDLADLRDRARWRRTPGVGRDASGWAWRLPAGDLLWGATALVVAGLLDVVAPGWQGGTAPDDLPADREERPWESAPRSPRPVRLGALPERPQAGLALATLAQVRAVRSALAAQGGMTGAHVAQAGAAVADAAARLAPGRGTVTVLAGPSTNGAVGLAAAAALAASGRSVEVVLLGEPSLAHQWADLVASGAIVRDVPDGPGEVVVDAMLGAAGRPPLAGRPASALRWLRRHDVPVLAVEVPSGLDAATGPRGDCVTADATVALGLPLAACGLPSAQVFLGDLVVADVGALPADWERVGLAGVPADLFAGGALLRLSEGAAGGDAGTPLQVAVSGRVGVRAVGVEPTLGGF